ncbi:hypothetical protein FUAX_48580 (plasmid) [Fulvitalea axinellae]|uniref:F5/8 type C domain-containing protein n=1 Tax=Fulvitalea axinellae TaxID=1182444 RepID=A0AAU9CJY5_9BACT|nr:hypothetical protein FUAX_48580 [Fulvitalea axinellae]
MKNRLLLGTLILAGTIFSCDQEDDIYVVPETEVTTKTGVHVMNDLSQYWTPNLMGQEGSVFSEFIDFGSQQSVSHSIAVPERLKSSLSTVSVLNVFVNVDNGNSYSDEDILSYFTQLENGGALAIFGMGDGMESKASANELASRFGFSYASELTPGSLEGKNLRSFNNGYALELTEGDWEVLLEAGGMPVCAVRDFGEGKVFASGIDLFGNEKVEANYQFYQDLLGKISVNKQGFASSDKFRPSIAPEIEIENDGSKLSVNNFQFEKAKNISTLFGEIAPEMEAWTGVPKAKEGAVKINVLPTGINSSLFGENMLTVGAYYENEEEMRYRLAELVHGVWSLPNNEPFGDNAFGMYAAYKVLERLGVSGARDKVQSYIDKAKADERYREFDPVNMTEEQQMGYPEELRIGKYLFFLDSLEKAYPDVDIIQGYYDQKRNNLPSYEGFVFTPHDHMWLFGNVVGDEEFLMNVKKNMGYALDSELIRNPAAYERIELDPTFWSAHSDYTRQEAKHHESKMFDDDGGTVWQTDWQNSSFVYPHIITIDMKQTSKVMGFRYLPRTQYKDHISDMDVFVSLDSENWTKVAKYIWPGSYSSDWKEFYCSEFKEARYVKIQINGAYRESNWQKYSNIAEFRVFAVAPEGETEEE